MSMYVVNGRPVYSDTLSHARPQLTYKPAGSKANYLAKTQTGRYLYTQEEIDALGREPQSVNADDGDKRIKLNARGKSSIPGLKMSPKSVTGSSKVSALRRYEARAGRSAPRNLQRNLGNQDPFANQTPRNLQPNLADTTYKAPADEPRSFFQRVGDVAKNIWGRIRSVAVSAIDTAKSGFSAARSWVSRAVSDAGKFARTALSAIKTKAKAIKDSVEGYWAGITGNYDYSGRSNEFNRAQMTGRMNASQVRKLGENIGTAAQNVGNAVSGFWNNQVVPTAVGVGDTVEGYARGITGNYDYSGRSNEFNRAQMTGRMNASQVRNLGENIGDAASSFWNDQVVPAAVAAGDTVEGYARGITGNYDYTGQHSGPEFARAQMTGRMNASQLHKLGENFVDGAGNMFNAAGEWIGNVADTVGQTAGNVANAIGQFVADPTGSGRASAKQQQDATFAANAPSTKRALDSGVPRWQVQAAVNDLVASGNVTPERVSEVMNNLIQDYWNTSPTMIDQNIAHSEQVLTEQTLPEQVLTEQILREQYR